MPFDTALAVDTNGNAWGWELNAGGELCLGDTTAYDTPQELPLTNVTALAGAAQHAVYEAAGIVETCGKNADGVAGTGSHSRTLALTPEAVTGFPAGVPVTQLYAAFNNAAQVFVDQQARGNGMRVSSSAAHATRFRVLPG